MRFEVNCVKSHHRIISDGLQPENVDVALNKLGSVPGRWGLDQHLGRGESLTLCRTKPSILLPCLGQRTCTLFRTELREIVFPV